MPRLLILLLGCFCTVAAAEFELVRPTLSYDRCSLGAADQEGRVRASGTIAGFTGKWAPVQGWFEYDVELPTAGWYEFSAPCEFGNMDFLVDGVLLPVHGGRKISNLWLEPGKHVFRLQRWHWTGFDGRFDRWILRAAGPGPAKALRLWLADGRSLVRAGELVRLRVQAGGRPAGAHLVAHLVDRATQLVVASRTLSIPAGSVPVTLDAPLLCANEGSYDLVLSANGVRLPAADLAPLPVIALDTRPPWRGGTLAKTLVAELDCVATAPPYAGAGGSRVVEGRPGQYREGGSAGFFKAQHHQQDCSWFAYPLTVPEAGLPYLLETDHPDDAFRTFTISIREAVAGAGAYPVTGGLDTGGSFVLSQGLRSHALLFWPRSTDLRVVFITAHDGRPGAAVAKIRLYRVEGGIPLPDLPLSGGRTFANWYEEGSNFLAMYGAKDDRLLGAERWARSVASQGGNLLMPTVAVYQMAMYPSDYNTAFSSQATFDTVRVLAMTCEKYGLGLIGEFHPEARELDRLGDPAATGRPRSNRMLDKTGRPGGDGGPRFHPLDPVNQQWYVGMVGEFADRYQDSPAFRGVSLRLMGWANPALNNFHSLDWGYDDLTVGLFERETGLATGVAADDPQRFQARHAWLMGQARERWIAWRCAKIADLYTRLRDRVRQARPDLGLYSTVFDLGIEAGIDPRLLGAIEGVTLINARHNYGRRAYTYAGPLADQRLRDQLIDPANLRALAPEGGGGAFLFSHAYFEATEVVVVPEALGFPALTKRSWSSGVVTPPGRLFLERYALALAESDALFLADGGNTYTLGQPILREFMQEFRRLPSTPFQDRSDAVDPVVVRELARPSDRLFYAVNRERFPVQVAIRLSGPGPVRRLASGEPAALVDGCLAFTLEPYQLLTFQTTSATSLAQVTTRVAEADRQPVEAMVAGAEALLARVANQGVKLPGEGRSRLAAVVAEARICLDQGRLWRARSVLESASLAELVYKPAGCFPPGLEFLADQAR